MVKTTCIGPRVAAIVAVLVVLAGGAATGAYYGVKGDKKAKTAPGGTIDASPSPPNVSTPPSRPNSSVSHGSNATNYAARDLPITRVNRLYGLSYSPFGLGDNRVCPPFDDIGQICLLEDQVKADMRTISSVTNRIKLYSILCYSGTVAILDYAMTHNMTVNLGVWVQSDDAANTLELTRFEQLYKNFARSGVITDITVGNEAVLVQKASVAQLVSSVRAVRAIIDANNGTALLGSAEVETTWLGLPVNSQSVGGAVSAVDMSSVVSLLDWIGLKFVLALLFLHDQFNVFAATCTNKHRFESHLSFWNPSARILSTPRMTPRTA
jgi:hypothetical protein